MKTRALALSIATIMTVQSAAFAQSRTDGIGVSAVQTARTNMQDLKNQLQSFDDSLGETEKAIHQQDHKGTFVNGLTVGAAALGVAVGGFAIYVSNGRAESSGIASLPFFAAAVASSAVSSIAGMLGVTRKATGDVKSTQAELNKTQKLIDEARSKNLTAEENDLLSTLESNLEETRSALSAYDEHGTELTRNRLISRAAQLGGTVLMVASAVMAVRNQQTNPDGVVNKIIGGGLILGGITTVGGHIATIVTGLQSYQADKVLKEIHETRTSLKTLSAQLN